MHQSNTSANQVEQRSRWHRAGTATGIVAGLVASVTILVPVAVNNTAFRNVLLNDALQKHGLIAEATRSSGGWLTPFVFHEVTVTDAAGRVTCDVQSLQSGRSILGHVLDGSSPVSIVLIRPRVDVALDEQGRLRLERNVDASPDHVVFQIRQGEFVLRVPWRDLPIVEIDGLDIQGSITQESSGRWLTAGPSVVLDRAELSDRHTKQNLALVAPLLSQATSLSGLASAELEAVRIRLDGRLAADQVLLQGNVQIHALEAELLQPLSAAVLRLVGQLNPSEMPGQVQLQSASVVDFHVTTEGIRHSGFVLTLPDVVGGLQVTSSGILRLDEQIELELDIRLPAREGFGSSLFNSLAGMMPAPVRLHVGGTVSEPVIATADGKTLLDNITQRVRPALHVEEADTVSGADGRIRQAGDTSDGAE